MRIGSNPQKKDFKVFLETNHRIVMVVFIPSMDGYYEKMFGVLKLSLQSLEQTIPKTSKITIVDNGSCIEVQNYLIELFKKNKIDALNLLSENIGKIDAIIGAARGCREPLITLSDCDILFRTHWVSETIKVFNSFPNVASVSPIPTRKAFNYFTFSTKEAIFKRKIALNFTIIPENKIDYGRFLKSINWEDDSRKDNLWPVVTHNNVKAIVGSDHQVLTIRRDVFFNNSPFEPSLIKVGNNSEENYIDFAIDSSGGLRLATFNFYAMHMGNVIEPWMNEDINGVFTDYRTTELYLKPKLHYLRESSFWYKIKKKLIKKFSIVKVPSNYY